MTYEPTVKRKEKVLERSWLQGSLTPISRLETLQRLSANEIFSIMIIVGEYLQEFDAINKLGFKLSVWIKYISVQTIFVGENFLT